MTEELKKVLAELGLNNYSIMTYIGLLANKDASTAYEISKTNKIPLSKIYEVLDSLVNKGLAYVIPGDHKKYMIINPKIALKNMLFKQLESINKLSARIDELTINLPKNEETVMIFKGKERLNVFESDLRNAKIYSYSFFRKIPSVNHPISKLIAEKIKQGVDVKGIIPETENKEAFNMWNKKFPGIYKIRQVLNSSRMGVIDDEIVRFTVLSNNEPTMIRIKNQDLARLLKKSFLEEWRS